MTRSFGFKFAVAAFASAAWLVLPATSAPISVFPKDLFKGAEVDDNQIVQVRGERGGARGGAVHRGGAARGGAAYRGGAVVRGGRVVTGGGGYYSGGHCGPNHQYCGGRRYGRGLPGGGGAARGGRGGGGGVGAVRGRAGE